jgi:PAS domain S-box-containing protein
MSPGTERDEIGVLRARLAEMEALLQRSTEQVEARFRQLADSAPLMIWTSGPDAMRNYMNAAWLEYRGRRIEEELGNGWADGVHPEDREICIGNYLKNFAARRPFRTQFRVMRAGGEHRWVEDTGVPVFDGDTFTGYIGAIADIHDRRRGIFTPDEEAVRMVFSLTERERQVLVLIAGGKSTKETAVQLGISYKTADSHRSRILEKLGVHETASMVRYAIRSGLIAP